MRSLLVALAAGASFACSPEPIESTPSDVIQLEWTMGEQFHVATRTRIEASKSEMTPALLDEETDADPIGPAWSDETVWTYSVTESGLKPATNDTLYPFSITATGEQVSLAVIKVVADPSLNTNPALLESDPTIYLVFREDRDRLAGIVTFAFEQGERVERAWSSDELGKSWSILSQSQLTEASTFLAPFSARWTDGERLLEDGRSVRSYTNDLGGVDVSFSNEMGGGLVTTTYLPDEPWPTFTATNSFEARLLTGAETERRRTHAPPPNDEEFDYRAALARSININKAMKLEADVIENGGFSSRVKDGYEPWAGNWWPLKTAELVFGYDGRPTLSQRVQDDVDAIRLEMKEFEELISNPDTPRSEYYAAKREYKQLERDLTLMLKDFYRDVQHDIDAGRLVIQDGQLVHMDGWSYEIDELSPMDKYALTAQLTAPAGASNPWLASAAEILTSYFPHGDSWWGHCNGWAAAAILTHEPREDRVFTAGEHDITFTTADMKGLLTEAHYSVRAHVYGSRYNSEEDDITDLAPGAFQQVIDFYFRQQQVPVVFDTTADTAVWNYPAYGAELVLDETTDPTALAFTDINTASVDELQTLPNISSRLAKRIVNYREKHGPFQNIEEILEVRGIDDEEFVSIESQITVEPIRRTFAATADVVFTTDGVAPTHIDGDTPEGFTKTWSYELVTTRDGTVVSGEWEDPAEHPDFAWVPYDNPTQPNQYSGENPHLLYSELLSFIGDDFDKR